jgi:hypothetical protein
VHAGHNKARGRLDWASLAGVRAVVKLENYSPTAPTRVIPGTYTSGLSAVSLEAQHVLRSAWLALVNTGPVGSAFYLVLTCVAFRCHGC